MKIALTGAGGTGKGTLARAITDKSNILVYVPSSVQFVGKIMFPDVINYEGIKHLDRISRWQYQYAAVMAQIQSENLLEDDFIVERSVFDFLAYVQDMPESEKLSYSNMIFNYYNKNPYDIIFYLPADDFRPTDDSPWKERNESARKETDDFIKKLVVESTHCAKSEVITLRGSVEERLKQALSAINK